MEFRKIWALGVVTLMSLAGPLVRAGDVYSDLVSFNPSYGDGMGPMAAPTQGTNGNFYGTTYYAGWAYGTVFEMMPDGGTVNLVSFVSPNGAEPMTKLVQCRDGRFYGTTYYGGTDGPDVGGYGTVFRVAPDGTFETLLNFDGTNGARPHGALVQVGDGSLYGTTESGGAANAGTVFRITPDLRFTTLVSFDGTNGAGPRAGLVIGSRGKLYGTTTLGGAYGSGTVFEMASNGVLSTLVSFAGTNGYHPEGEMLWDRTGVLYGTTAGGGVYASGTVFRVTPSGKLSLVVSFGGTNGIIPFGGLISGTDGNFYGTTSQGGVNGYGTVFRMKRSGRLDVLWSFLGRGYPFAGLTEGADGNLYGATYSGGYGYGSIFRLNVALPQVRPVVSVTRVTGTDGGEVTLDGRTVAHRVPVASVSFQINSGNWVQATSENDWRDWHATLTPQRGVNVVRIQALDNIGDRSRANTFSFYYPVECGAGTERGVVAARVR